MMSAEKAVVEALEKWATRSMEWGRDDCMLAVADVIKAITGADPAENYRGRYKTKLGAYRVLGKGGVGEAAKQAAKRLGWREIDPRSAKTGDVGLIMTLEKRKNGEKINFIATLCRTEGWFVARSLNGFVALPSAKVFRAWSVR